MDPKLVDAATKGDVNFLRLAEATCQNSNYFQSRHQPEKGDKEQAAGNMLHLAASYGRYEFIQTAIEIFPVSTIHSLLKDNNIKTQMNPIHVAAEKGYHDIVKLIIDFYDQNKDQVLSPKPWLAQDKSKMTPLHAVLRNGWEECWLRMVSLVDDGTELEQLCNMYDNNNSPLSLAIRKGYNQVARCILDTERLHTLALNKGSALHFVTNCSEEVFRLLLEKHPSYIKEINLTVICKWTQTGKLWPLVHLLNKLAENDPKRNDLVDLIIYKTNNRGSNVFHTAARYCKPEAARTLAKIYRDERAKKSKQSSLGETNGDHDLPWLVSNNKGQTPIRLAMKNNEADTEYRKLSKEVNIELVRKGKSELLFHAIEKKKKHAAECIWDVRHHFGWSLYPPQEWKEIWQASLKFSDEVADWVTNKLLSSSTYNANEIIEHTLPLVSESGSEQVLKSILKTNNDALNLARRAWVKACEKGHYSTIIAFVEHCHNFREICGKEKDTPLHHIRFEEHNQYVKILENPVILGLKNFQDKDGQTPLHRAIRDDNLLLAEVLLTTDGVFRNIKDKTNKTAMDLLINPCIQDWKWDAMCNQLGIVPGLKMSYFQNKTNLYETRNALSVVAALLATITFTVGFTVPGGVKSDSTGKATLANNAAFIAFLLADAFAMCSSMLVLVCLIWSMINDYHKALFMVDKSVLMLMVALCSTLVAFMTGVYVVVPHKSLWVAIVVLVMSSLSIILSEGTIINKLTTIVYPALHRKHKDRTQTVEQGGAGISQEDNSQSYGRVCACLKGDRTTQQPE